MRVLLLYLIHITDTSSWSRGLALQCHNSLLQACPVHSFYIFMTFQPFYSLQTQHVYQVWLKLINVDSRYRLETKHTDAHTTDRRTTSCTSYVKPQYSASIAWLSIMNSTRRDVIKEI